jgi:hypothetical protein
VVARLQDGLREQGQYAIRSSFLQVLQFDDVARVSLADDKIWAEWSRSGGGNLPAMRAETRLQIGYGGIMAGVRG